MDIQRDDNELWKTTVTIKDAVLATETSKSHRYSRQKALKKALINLADDAWFIETTRPEFDSNQSKLEQLRNEKLQAEKEEKLRLRAEKEERKRRENELKHEKRKAEKALEDQKRRTSKAEAAKKKESRKGKNTIYRAYSDEEIAAMNPAKRRRLEDLGILAKQK